MTNAKLLLALALAACTESAETQKPAAPAEDLLVTPTEKGVTGSLGATTFTSEMATDDVLDIQVNVNGMVLTALVDFKTGVIEYDGYTASSGENTQMTDEDRTALLQLESGLATLQGDLPFALEKLRSFVATEAEHPTTVDLQDIQLVEENRSWTSLCYAKNSYYPASHDCDTGGFWIDATTLDNVWLSSTGDLGGPDGVAWYFPAGGCIRRARARRGAAGTRSRFRVRAGTAASRSITTRASSTRTATASACAARVARAATSSRSTA